MREYQREQARASRRLRICLDCPADISERPPRAVRCEIHQREPRFKAARVCLKCGEDLSERGNHAVRCAKHQAEHVAERRKTPHYEEVARARRREYMQTTEAKARRRKVRSTSEAKARQREYTGARYRTKPGFAESQREYALAYQRELRSTPEGKERKRGIDQQHRERPGVRERRRESQREYSARPEVRDARREYNRSPENRAIAQARNKARYDRLGGALLHRHLPFLTERGGGWCFLCDTPLAGKLEVDHIQPQSLGGSDELFNLQAAHEFCNRSKRDRVVEQQWWLF